MPDHIYLRLDRAQKPYFVLPHGQSLTVAKAHELYPQLIGRETAEAIEIAKKEKIAVVKLKNEA